MCGADEGRALRARAVGIPGAMVAGLGLDPDEVARIRAAADLLLRACTPDPAPRPD